MSPPTSSENIVSQKVPSLVHSPRRSAHFDNIADLLVKTGVGFGIGVVASVILFKRRTWPIALSSGFGMGAAYADCDRSFNPARVPGTRIISDISQLEQSK
ncbi:hypothetical protein JVT61DRAFT_8314 [Boletus reticuloceps]|uniref:MICOS complex subunit MIC10 n=1 Tax=Boletus reticuloceps TaxID=495285 RepID=A0A8I2YZZ2_9AGAM|nr:hypothetical protein JVT61DRAFT_8314 [Boletus reticuloceps]